MFFLCTSRRLPYCIFRPTLIICISRVKEFTYFLGCDVSLRKIGAVKIIVHSVKYFTIHQWKWIAENYSSSQKKSYILNFLTMKLAVAFETVIWISSKKSPGIKVQSPAIQAGMNRLATLLYVHHGSILKI